MAWHLNSKGLYLFSYRGLPNAPNSILDDDTHAPLDLLDQATEKLVQSLDLL